MNKIISRIPTEEYKNNFDAIFRKKEETSIDLNVRCRHCDTMNKLEDAICKNCGEVLE